MGDKSNNLHSFFSSKQPDHPAGPSPQMTSQLSNIARRLKLIEEAVENMRKKEQLNEQNALSQFRKQNLQIKSFEEQIKDMKRAIESMKDNMQLIIEELKSTAKNQDVKVLQKYIDIWQPIQFVTAKQVERIVRDVLREQAMREHAARAPPPEKPAPAQNPPHRSSTMDDIFAEHDE
ncbi:MAG: hypothetical protein ACOCWQ_01560 [Nanoarchaeota archaeon]